MLRYALFSVLLSNRPSLDFDRGVLLGVHLGMVRLFGCYFKA